MDVSNTAPGIGPQSVALISSHDNFTSDLASVGLGFAPSPWIKLKAENANITLAPNSLIEFRIVAWGANSIPPQGGHLRVDNIIFNGSSSGNYSFDKVIRGGSWNDAGDRLQKSNRLLSLYSASGDEFTGFRMAGSLPPAIAIVLPPTGLPQGSWGDYYEYQLEVLGGLGPYAWQILSGALPDGITLTPDGRLVGTPLQSGAFTFTVQVTDSLGNKATQQMTLLIALASSNPSVILGSGIDSGGGLTTTGTLNNWTSMGYPIQTIRTQSGNTTINPGFLRTLIQLQTAPAN